MKSNLPTVNSYLKNLGKSIKYVAINEIRETIPIVFEAKETNDEAISTIRSTFRSKNKINTISKIAKESDFFKSGKEVFKNLKSSIKTGTFYSKARDDKASEEFFNEMTRGDDEESFDDFNMDEDLNADDSEESLNKSADALNELNEDLNAGFEANATAISNTTMESARYVGETIKGSAAMAYAQNSEQTFLMKSGFKSLDDGLKKLISFNADSLQKHIQNSTSFFDNTSKLLSEQNAMIKEMLEMQRNVYKNEQEKEKKDPTFNKYASIVSSSGVVNLSDYFKNIKENTAEYLEPVNMILNMIKANPMEAVLQGMLSFIGSDSMKYAGANLNKTLSGAFGKYLSFLEKQAKKNGGIWSTLNDIFGIKNREKREVDTGNFQKGPMQFNGIANKAITEVIPGYLARIEAALTGEEERYFNFSNGRWTNAKKIRKEYNARFNNTNNAGLSSLFSEISSSLNKIDFNNYAGTKINSRDKKELFNKVMQVIIDSNGNIDDSFIVKDKAGSHNTFNKASFYKAFGFGTGENLTPSQKAMLDILATALANTSTSTRASLHNSVRQSRGGRSVLNNEIENDPNSIYRILVNNQLSGSKSVSYALPYGQGSIEQPSNFIERPAFTVGNRTTRSTRDRVEAIPIQVYSATNNKSYDYSKKVFYNISTIDDFIDMHDSADESIVRKLIGYIQGLHTIGELNEHDEAVSEFKKMVAELNSSDFIEDCKVYADYIDYIQASKKTINTSGKQFAKLPLVARNFYMFISGLATKNSISNSEELAKSVFDNVSYKPTYDYDKYKGTTLWDKLDEAKGIDKLGVLMSYTKKLSGMPFDILGSVIAKTDRIIYDLFFGNQQIKGKKINGFFDLMITKIGDAVDDLYKEVKRRIWGDDQWNMYKDTVYSGFRSFVNFFKDSPSTDGVYEKKNNIAESISTKITSDNSKKLNDDETIKKNTNSINFGTTDFSTTIGTGFDPSIAKNDTVESAAYGMGIVPKTDIYTLHKGEAVIPAYLNPSYTGNDVDPAKHAKDEKKVAKKYGLNVKGYAKGTTDKSNIEQNKESAFKRLKHTYPALLGESTVGGVIGTIVAGPAGLLGGAALGAANYILKNSVEVNKFLFGDTDKKSLLTRTKSGLKKILPKTITNFFEEQTRKVKEIGKFAVAGGALGLLGGPFGIIGGVALGASTGFLKNYEFAQTMLFGNHDIKGKIDKVLNKKYLASIGLGSLTGGLMFGPLGVIGGAMLGVAGKYASASDKFADWMFGARDPKTGERKYKEGYLGRIGEKIVMPLKTLKDDILGYMKKNIFDPIGRAFVPLTRYTQLGMRGVFKKVSKLLDNTVNPSLRIKWYQNLPVLMKGPMGRYVGHGLAGAAGGFMYGGPIGAIIGSVLGGASAFKIKDKTIASWFGKGLKAVGTWPGKALDKVTNKLNRKLISNGNMDSLSMSASERLDFMSKHNMSYSGYNGVLFHQNDQSLADSSLSELQAMKNSVEMMKLASTNPQKNKALINGKLKEAVKSIPNLDHTAMKKVLACIRNAIKNSDDPNAVEQSLNRITKILRDKGLNEEQIEKYIKPINIGISALSVNGESQKYAKDAIADKTKYLKNAYNFNVVDGDIDKALEQVGTEIQRRKRDGESVAKESLSKGELAITESNKKIEDTIKVSNLYLAAITEFLETGKITDNTQKLIDDSNARADKINIDEEYKTRDDSKKELDRLDDKIHNKKRLTKTEQNRYKNLRARYDNANRKIKSYNEYQTAKKIESDATWGNKTGNLEYDATEVKPNYNDFIKQTGLNDITFEQFKAFSLKVNYNTIQDKLKYISPNVISAVIDSPGITTFMMIRIYELAKKGIDLDPTIEGNAKNLSLILGVSDNIFKKRILNLLDIDFRFDNFEQIIELDDKEFTILEELYDKGRKSGLDYSQSYWVSLVRKITSGKIKKELVDESLGYEYAKNQLNKNGVFTRLNKVSHHIYGKRTNKEKMVYQFEHGTHKSIFDNDAGYSQSEYNDTISNNRESETQVVYSDSAKTMLTFKKTSDGGWSLDSGDKDSKEGVQRADQERNAILSLGEYAKLKLKDATGNLKKKGAGLVNAFKKTSLGSMLSSLKGIFADMFGGGLDVADALARFIPGYSLLKGKIFRGAGNMLERMGDKLSDKAKALSNGTGKLSKFGKVGSILGKVGGKALGAASFFIKNMADAASAAANAEESTPEFETELEALHYVARKISGVEAAVVAAAQQASDSTGLTDLLPDKLKPGVIPTIDPKTGKPVATAPTINKPGFFSNLYSKAKNAMSAVGTKAMAAVGPVLGFVQNGLKRVFEIASKFLPSSLGQKISSFSTAILKKVGDPKVAIKVAEKAAKKGIQLGLGPIGWAILAGSIAVSFYQGYNNAETIWNDGNENKETDLSMGEKAICGVCSVVANELLLGIFSPSEILGLARTIFGKIAGITDTIKETASNAMNSISQVKDKLLNTGKEMWDNVKTSLGKGWGNIKNSVANAIQGVKDTFEKFKDIGFNTLVDILKQPIDWIKNTAKSLFDSNTTPSSASTNKVYTSITPTASAVTADTSKIDLNVDPDNGIGTGLASTGINYGKIDLNADPDKGIGTQTTADTLNKARTPNWKDIYSKAGRGGPLPGDSLFKYRLGIGGGDMTPEAIWKILTTKYHYSNQAAAAIMGSMQQESSFNPLASQEGGGIEASIVQGEGTNGFGLCQWTGSRTQALVDYCSSHSLDPLTAEGQIAFMNYEMGQRGSNTAFNNAKSLDDALLVMKKYEGYGEIGQREDYARQIFQNQGKGLASAGSAISGSSSISGNTSSSSSSPIDNSLFGKIDQAFAKAFAPFNSIFGNTFGGSTTSSSSNDSSSPSGNSSSATTSGSSNIGAAATDMSGDIDAGSTAAKLIANLKSASGNASDVEITAPYAEENHFGHTHGGIDIAAPSGTPIKSPIAGVVVDNSFGGGYGHFVQIKDKNNMDHLFPHMVSPSPLTNGTQVAPGDVVGYVGSTGNSTGPHVHYEIDDHAVNPGAMSSGPHINPGKYVGGPLPGDSTLKFRKKVNDLANAGNKAAIKALKKGYGSDHIGTGGPTPNDDLRNYSNSGLEGKDYSDQFNQIIQLLSVIASAVQSQVTVSATSANNAPVNTGSALSTTTPNASLLNIIKSMTTIANH